MNKLTFDKEEQNLRKLFPILNNNSTIYLDNAATSQKPACVLEAIDNYYKNINSNPFRGLYDLSVDTTNAYEAARSKVAEFINSPQAENIIFTRNASESLNLVAYTYGLNFIDKDSEILVSICEHHSNFLPWQNLAKKTGATIKYLPCNKDGSIDINTLNSYLSDKTKIFAITHISNVIGRENDIKEFTRLAHSFGSIVVLDAAQSIPHIKIDVRDLDVDFLAFSGHKMFAPMGIGVLYGKYALLDKMPPFLFGGEMIESVRLDSTSYASVPHKFEAGTVNVSGAIGLATAIDFINSIGFDTIKKREEYLTKLALDELETDKHIHIIGSKDYTKHHGILSFTIDDVHPHDIAEILNSNNIAIRAGHHCAQPLLNHLGFLSTARASFAFYNTKDEILYFCKILKTIREVMGYGK